MANETDNSTAAASTSCSPYDHPDYARVALTSSVSAILSLAASFFVIFIIILFKKWNFVSQRLILYLAIASLMTSFSTVLHRIDYDNQTSSIYVRFCTFGGFFEQVTSWMLLNSIVVITVYLFALAVFAKDTKKLEPLYGLMIFLFPILLGLFPFIKSSYGLSGAWCWIRIEDRRTCEHFLLGEYFIFALWFVPLYITLGVLVVMYVIILVKLIWKNYSMKKWHREVTAETQHLLGVNRRTSMSLIAYPLLYFFLGIFPLMNRIQNGIDPEHPVLALWYMAALAFPLTGGLIGIAYALDVETRQRLTWVQIRAAFRQWKEKDSVEYPVTYVNEDIPETGYQMDGV